MKKHTALLVTAVAAMALSSGFVQAAEEPADGEYLVAYIAKDTKSSFHSILNGTAGPILDQMVKDGVIDKWTLLDGLEDAATQCDLVETAINMGADCVVLLPAEATASSPVVTRCKEEGIPCVVINSMTDNTESDAVAYVGSDDVQAGEMMGQFVKDSIPDGGKWCMIKGVTGNSAAEQRAEGALNILGEDENWELMDTQDGAWDPSKGVQFAEDWLQLYGDELKAIICGDDDTSAAVQVAANAAGYEDLIVTGVNGGATACALIADGQMDATIYQDGVGQATKGMEIVKAIASGEEYEAGVNWVPFVLVTEENVADYMK